MATESNVAIAPNNPSTTANNIRTVTVYPNAPVSVDHGEDQQVVTLAGSDGTMVDLENGAIPIFSDEIVQLLKAIIRRLDILNATADPRRYIPPDDLYK